MKDLRSEIRSAFEKEQAENPPSPELRRTMAQAVAAAPARDGRLQWLAVAAALLLGLAVVAGLMSTRLVNRASVPAKPHPSPIADYGPPPPGVPLIYVDDPVSHPWLIGFDWSGKPRATVKFDPQQVGGLTVTMAPDGQQFLGVQGGKGGHWQFFGRLGQLVGSGSMTNAYQIRWADDGTHLCAMTSDNQSLYFLWTLDSKGSPQPVAEVARDSTVGQSSLDVISCSFTNNLAIVVRTTVAWPSEIWVIRLSDGVVLSHHIYDPSQQLGSVVASPDGAYVAESSSASVATPNFTNPHAPSTVLRRVADWKVVLTLPAQAQVLGFSGDDTHVLISKQPSESGGLVHLEIIDWTVPHGVWNYDGPEALDRFTARPGGGDFALALIDPSLRASPPDRVLLVHADGTTTDIPGHYEAAW